MRNFLFLSSIFILIGCGSEPKVIQQAPETADATKETQAMQNPHTHDDVIHKVRVEEVLQAERYTYLYVTEGEEKIWIAVPKMDAEIGETYLYKGGIMKKNFESLEFNRVFETLYLISDIRKEMTGGSAVDQALANAQGRVNIKPESVKVDPVQGGVLIADLFKNHDRYAGKTILVRGQCVKINPGIMGRNWVHLRDGSDKAGDLTVTTNENIPVGTVVTVEGTVSLNKDFGAGYKYDVILEDAVVVKN